MNKHQTLEILLGILGTLLIVTALGLYIFNEPDRIVTAQNDILAVQLDDAMTLYAENCAVCHGLNGEGIGATPALNNPALQTMPFDDLYKIIARGRFDTAMPAWSKDDGGPLSDYQIEELVALVQSGDWAAAGDRVVNLGLAPLIPFTTDPDPVLLRAVGTLTDGETLQKAITIYASQCVACHGADGLGTGIAPALNDPAVREKTADELTRTITFGSAGTLMAGWSNVLSPEDITAMVTLVQRWDEIPTGAIPAPDVPIPTTAESIALGSQLYSANCSRCHGPDGQGTLRAPSLNVKSFLTDTADQAIQQIITLGVPGTAMPAWGDRMTDAEIQAIVGFIRQWEPAAPEIAQPLQTGGGGPPWLRNAANATATANAALYPTATPTPASVSSAEPSAPASDLPTATTTPSPAGQGMTAEEMAAHKAQEAANGGTSQGQGGPPWAQDQAQTSSPAPLDWRVLALITVGLSIAFTLTAAGISSMKKYRK
jgi:mono/diheme cytochrome c family protein